MKFLSALVALCLFSLPAQAQWSATRTFVVPSLEIVEDGRAHNFNVPLLMPVPPPGMHLVSITSTMSHGATAYLGDISASVPAAFAGDNCYGFCVHEQEWLTRVPWRRGFVPPTFALGSVGVANKTYDCIDFPSGYTFAPENYTHADSHTQSFAPWAELGWTWDADASFPDGSPAHRLWFSPRTSFEFIGGWTGPVSGDRYSPDTTITITAECAW